MQSPVSLKKSKIVGKRILDRGARLNIKFSQNTVLLFQLLFLNIPCFGVPRKFLDGLCGLPGLHLTTSCRQVPQMTKLRTCLNMTLAVEHDVKPQL